MPMHSGDFLCSEAEKGVFKTNPSLWSADLLSTDFFHDGIGAVPLRRLFLDHGEILQPEAGSRVKTGRKNRRTIFCRAKCTMHYT